MRLARIFGSLSILFVSSLSFAQEYCILGRFSDTPIFTESELSIEENIGYGNANDWLGINLSFSLDLTKH